MTRPQWPMDESGVAPASRRGLRWLTALAALGLFGAAGCKSDPAAGTGSKAGAASAGSTAASTAASTPEQIAKVARPTLGKWVVDLAALLNDTPVLRNADAKVVAQTRSTIAGLVQGTAIELNADATLKMTFGKNEQTGTFSVAKVEAGTYTFEMSTRGKPGTPLRTEQITAKLEGDRLTLTGTDGRAMQLLKVGSPAEVAQAKAIAEAEAAEEAAAKAEAEAEEAAKAAGSTPGSTPPSGPDSTLPSAAPSAPSSAPATAP